MTPRLRSEKQAAESIGLPLADFRELVKNGRLPGPMLGTDLYDMRAIDAALDRISGLGAPQNALDAWIETRHAR